jgi:hypothetical protein
MHKPAAVLKACSHYAVLPLSFSRKIYVWFFLSSRYLAVAKAMQEPNIDLIKNGLITVKYRLDKKWL